MAQQRRKRIELTHPAVTFTAAGLLLIITFNQMLQRPSPVRLAVATPAPPMDFQPRR